MNGKIVRLLTLVMVLAMIASPAFASPLGSPIESTAQPPTAAPAAPTAPVFQAAEAAGPARYFVILSAPSVPSYTGGIAGFEATNPASKGLTSFDAESEASQAYASYLEAQQATLVADAAQVLGRSPEVVYQLQFALNAVVMVLDPAEAQLVAKLPGVVQVERDVAEELQTDVGPQWIGAPGIWSGTSTGGVSTKGEGVIIGVLDTGVNMDHPSFAATAGDGYVHTNPFGPGNYKGWCNPAHPNYNPAYVCNAKLVGAWDYSDASWGETDGPEDSDGHGSHTASTAGGNELNPGTVVLGSYPYSPAISGVAPRANIIAYDVCGTSCFNTDVVAALNQAILDGVHVTNESIGIGGNTWTGAKQAAYLSVFNANITAARSAGNSGPGASTVGSTPPWVITVGANTHNRAGTNSVTNLAGGSTAPPGGGTLNGLGVSGSSAVSPIVYAGNAPYNDALCLNPFPANSVTGQIVICDRGTNARVAKGWNVLQGAAAGMVLVNTAAGQSLNGDLHHLPAVHLTDVDGVALKAWVNSGAGHQGRIAGTALTFVPANGDIMAGFSSRGPHPIPSLLTPDVTNPGVDILAAYRSGAVTPEVPSVEYAFVSGTSMSSPHTAGSAALVKALHPTWTPAEIKSALMNTGKYTGILKEDGVTPAIPFDMGTGRVDLNQAGNAGLVLNETGANFLAANPDTGGDPKTLNLASLANASCAGACSWTRTVEATRAGTWSASYVTPAGMTLTATPNNFTLAAGQTQTLNVTANVAGLPLNTYGFGYVVLNEGTTGRSIHLTVVVRPVQATIDVTPTSLAATQPQNTTTTQALTIANVGTAPLTWQIAEAPLAMGIELNASGPDAPDAPIMLAVDDGVGENAIGLGGAQFLWLNRFTPTAGQFPVVLDQVDIMFGYPAGGSGGINVGELVDIYLYEDADGNPANGAVHRASLTGQAVQAVNGTTWSTYNLAAPVSFTGPGDILIAVVNRTAGVTPSTFPAVIDQSSGSQQRSWAGFGPAGFVPGNPPTLPLPTFGIIDSFGAQFAGNWLVRGFGESAAACDNPADVPWLTVTPTGGTTPAGSSTGVTVGFDSTGLAVGAYNAVLCVTSNDPQTPLVEVPVALEVVETVPEPNIDVHPLSMASTQPPDTTTSQTLDVSNTGDADLTWNIFEDTSAAPELADWSDNFDTYSTGSQLHGQGGWKGWFNDPAAGALASSAQARSAPNSAAILGASDLVHEYGETDGQWVYTAWQYVPTSFTGESYFILLNAYDDAGATNNWSTQVMFDGAANQVVNEGVSGGTLPLVRGQWVEIRVEIDLDADTGAFYYNNQLLYSGTWSGQVSGGGATTIGAVDLFANGASVVYYDDMSLVAVGGPAVCDAPGDIPWASVSPANGTTAPGATTPVDVAFDSTGLALGTYTGNLCVTSNDPDAGPGNGTDLVVVPVELVVTEPQNAAIEIVKTVGTDPAVCAAESNITVPAGTEVYYCYTVTNTGDVTLNLHDLVDDQLGALFTGFAYALTPGSSVNTVDAGLTISAIINAPTLNVATWTAYNTGGASVTATATAFVDVIYFSCQNPEEDFENGVPALGWSVVSNVVGGPEWTDIAGCGQAGNYTGGLGDAACMSPGSLVENPYDAELRMPVFSLVGYSNATISFLMNYQNWAGIDELNFDISADGGVTWTTLRSYNTDQGAFQNTPGVYITTDLAAYLGQPNLMLRWHYFWPESNALGWYAQIDEAEFKCIEIPPTAVTLDSLNATPAAAAGSLSLLALPAVVSLALGAAYALRRKD